MLFVMVIIVFVSWALGNTNYLVILAASLYIFVLRVGKYKKKTNDTVFSSLFIFCEKLN